MVKIILDKHSKQLSSEKKISTPTLYLLRGVKCGVPSKQSAN